MEPLYSYLLYSVEISVSVRHNFPLTRNNGQINNSLNKQSRETEHLSCSHSYQYIFTADGVQDRIQELNPEHCNNFIWRNYAPATEVNAFGRRSICHSFKLLIPASAPYFKPFIIIPLAGQAVDGRFT